MKKIYSNPTVETTGINVLTYLCQATSQHTTLTSSESTDPTEKVF